MVKLISDSSQFQKTNSKSLYNERREPQLPYVKRKGGSPGGEGVL